MPCWACPRQRGFRRRSLELPSISNGALKRGSSDNFEVPLDGDRNPWHKSCSLVDKPGTKPGDVPSDRSGERYLGSASSVGGSESMGSYERRIIMANPSTPFRGREETRMPGSNPITERAWETGASVTEKAKEVGSSAAQTAGQAVSGAAQKAKDMASSAAHTASDVASNVGHRAEEA